MKIEKTYYVEAEAYDKNGRNLYNFEWFSDKIRSFERDFIDEFSALFAANYLFLNRRLMKLFEQCFVIKKNETFGMELINGKIDFKTDFKIEKHSQFTTIYGVGSVADEHKPLFLIIDNDLRDDEVVLKFIPDDDDQNPNEQYIPVRHKNLIS